LLQLENERQLVNKATDVLNEIDSLKLKYFDNVQLLNKKVEDYHRCSQQLLKEREKLRDEIQHLQQKLAHIQHERSRQQIAHFRVQQEKLQAKILMRLRLCQIFFALAWFFYLATLLVKFYWSEDGHWKVFVE
jgi:hypothetical protein